MDEYVGVQNGAETLDGNEVMFHNDTKTVKEVEE